MREIKMTQTRNRKTNTRKVVSKTKVFSEKMLSQYFNNIAISDSEEHAAYNIGAIQSIVKVLHFQGGDIKINVEIIRGRKH